ncbi:V/A-type H+-transporting ATPase subunit E [Caldicoprobacter guelmensis]|uniref:V-type ATP synthase subunit E n=1 Tax=Caldicoprobacter guelmensis TaxID=1170224 RepID=UPI0019591250|nr:V-type ATP synthase subunit E family protein [Caldicoprobacter guelmensis]MBM7582435.1 V/A-type H+-transporting ATPase subunit E [Caldicoprobacter guelmensis]
MNGFDNIKQRIMEDARQEAERIIQSAEGKAREIKEAKATEAGKLKKRLTEQNMEAAREHKRRLLVSAQLEIKKKVLAAKRDMIEAVFKGVIERISGMADDQYRGVIASMLLNAPIQGDEEVVFSVYDQYRLDQSFLDYVNEQLKKQGRKGELRLAPDRGQFKAGFVLRRHGIEINASFEAIVRALRVDVEPQVAEILFGELA